MYNLIKAGVVSMEELQEVYTLDEALKLYALWQMERDIEAAQIEEANSGANRTSGRTPRRR